ncbi:cold shock domain-containing protein [Roseibium salinum]|nr:cold shock domain-containing protein [Roseibium salinum]
MKLHGTVDRLVPEEGFGFIKTADEREYFFRRESLTSPELWEALVPGSEVRFTEHDGEKGPPLPPPSQWFSAEADDKENVRSFEQAPWNFERPD